MEELCHYTHNLKNEELKHGDDEKLLISYATKFRHTEPVLEEWLLHEDQPKRERSANK